MLPQPPRTPPTQEALLSRLLTFEYPTEQAANVAQRLLSLQGDLHEALLAWWNDETPPNIVRGAYSLLSLQASFGLTQIGAILTLDDIDQHPEETLSLLQHGLR
jgi:hypothetical protein